MKRKRKRKRNKPISKYRSRNNLLRVTLQSKTIIHSQRQKEIL
jgi:hypothetical protein